jgi:hypothetical protein
MCRPVSCAATPYATKAGLLALPTEGLAMSTVQEAQT